MGVQVDDNCEVNGIFVKDDIVGNLLICMGVKVYINGYNVIDDNKF